MIQTKRGRRPNFWTEKRVQQLRDMNARGATDGQIAKAMGVTRNTIIGKRQRLGLFAANAVVSLALTPAQRRARKNAHERQRRAFLRAMKPKVVKVVPPPIEPTPIGPRNDVVDWNACRWVFGDPRDTDWRMCGHEKADGSSYCEHHHMRAMAPRVPARLAA